MKITIVIPVYNVEQYIERCLQSIINQTYADLEILIINDGSKDRSVEICEKFKEVDNRIRIINKENGGLSDARNRGIDEANGEYIYFVDSDDYIDINTIQNFIDEIENDEVDIVIGNGIRIENNKKTKIKEQKIEWENIIDGTEYLYKAISENEYIACAWLNLYSTAYLKEKVLYFKKNLLHEDEEWTIRVLYNAKTIKVSNQLNYYYLIRENSITTQKDKTKNIIDLMSTCYDLEKCFKNIPDKRLKKVIYSHLAYIYMGSIGMCNEVTELKKLKIKRTFPLFKNLNLKNSLKSYIFLVNIKLFFKWSKLKKRRNYEGL